MLHAYMLLSRLQQVKYSPAVTARGWHSNECSFVTGFFSVG